MSSGRIQSRLTNEQLSAILEKHVLPNGIISSFKSKEQREKDKERRKLKKCNIPSL